MASFWMYLLSILVALIVCGVSTVRLYLIWLQRKYSHIPGPEPDSFIMGNIPTLQRYKKEGKFLGVFVLDMCKKYGTTLKLRLLNHLFVFTADPQAIRQLLVTGNHKKPDVTYSVMHDLFWERFLGKSLPIETDQKVWIWRRNLVNPCFQKSYLQGIETSFNTQADILMDRLAEVADGKTKVLMGQEFNQFTLDTISQLAFGIDTTNLDHRKKAEESSHALTMILRGLSEIFRNPLFKFNITQWRFIQDVRKALQFIRRFSKDCFHERMTAVNNGDYTPDDILNHLVKIKLEYPELDEEVIMDDITSFFIAGQETTANLLSFTLVNLWKHKDVYERLRKEVLDTLGVKPFIGSNDIKKMTYLDMVIKETLRLNPPVPNIFRENKHDMEISGYKIPAGTTIFLSSYVSSRLEEYFPDPTKFDPERFNPDSEDKIPQFTYFPFALGPRTCIGKSFADIEAKIVITKIIQRFDFEMDPDQSFEIEETVTLRPKGGAVCMFSFSNTSE